MADERVVDPNKEVNEEEIELSIRPQILNEYNGQYEAKEMLDVYI